jgi:hypothetical protein
MNTRLALVCLRSKWKAYIQRHGHTTASREHLNVIRSFDEKGRCYRWLLLVSNTPEHRLSRSERGFVRMHLRGAKKGERVYLVVGFPNEPGRMVALPGQNALAAGRLYSDRAGIAWDG